MIRLLVLLALCVFTGTGITATAAAQDTPGPARSTHVIVVITDGLRWQEFFGGADSTLMGRSGRVADSAGLQREFWRDTPQARREAMLPFLWKTIATRGQVYGDSAAGSNGVVTNGYKFSYPAQRGVHRSRRPADRQQRPSAESARTPRGLNTQPTRRIGGIRHVGDLRRIITTERSKVPVFTVGTTRSHRPAHRAAALRDVLSTQTRCGPRSPGMR
jgi:hypothetical protein